jgi:hypothetical protein
LAGAVVLITAALFVAAGIETSFARALDILEGSKTSFGFGARDGVTVPLSVDGYLLVPIFIALAVTSAVQTFVGRRLVTRRELDDKAKEVLTAAREVAAKTGPGASED